MIPFLLIHCSLAALGACTLVEETPDVVKNKECGQPREDVEGSAFLQAATRTTVDNTDVLRDDTTESEREEPEIVSDDALLYEKSSDNTTFDATGAVGKRWPYQLFSCPTDTVPIVGKNHGFYRTVAKSISMLYTNLQKRQDKQDLAACFARFAGHDLMDFRFWKTGKATGGSDGCVDFGDVNNGGLEECVANSGLPKLYEGHCDKVSLADYFVIAAETMMSISSDHWSNFRKYGSLEATFMRSFEFGRETRRTCPGNVNLLPDPEEGCFDLKRAFVDHIFLDQNVDQSWKLTAAISGVHSLGESRQQTSGYDGAWTEDPWKFNNAYFTNILNRGWGPELSVGGNPKRNQWVIVEKQQPAKKLMMLNSDMCLLYDNGLDSVDCDTKLLGGRGFNQASSNERLHRNVFCERIRGRGFFLNARERTCCAWVRPDKMWADPMDSWHQKNPNDMWKPLAALYDQTKTNSHCGGEFSTPQDAWNKFNNFRQQCCASLKGGESGDRNDCDYRGNLEAPAWEWVNRFALNESAWLTSFVEAWTWATTNSIHYTQDRNNAATRFVKVTRPNCGCCRKNEIVQGDEGYEECEKLKKEDTYEETFWTDKKTDLATRAF